MRPPTRRASDTCWRCHQRLLHAEEQTQHKLLRARLLRVTHEGTLWVQCTTRGCQAWCVVTAPVRELVCVALGQMRAVGCSD